MALLGLPVRLAPVDIDEADYLLPEPTAAAINVAVAKVRAVARQSNEIVLAADTLVVIDNTILGKPGEPAEARKMLERLRGRAHQVLTGVAMHSAELQWAGVVATQVVMRPYRDGEVEAYIARGEPFDKAGGYAVQDREFHPVERLVGCYLNVVGLPVCAVATGLNALGVATPSARPPVACDYCARGRGLLLIRSG